MFGRRKSEQKSGRRTRVSSPYQSSSSTPPSQQKRFKAKGAPSEQRANSSQSSVFQNAASTAAGVALGSVVGQAIGSTFSGTADRGPFVKAESSDSAETRGLCVPEIREFFECASKTENLDSCKAFHDIWMKCQHEYKHHGS
ncbi:uncharacterized protein LOC143184802 [Calliopsis andreniformis]|uniref:uncharacterized protein LOC143184802 n=1 Tax=Calliopsis andreniformis TaxID=337506 RepID=UPI003FCD741D